MGWPLEYWFATFNWYEFVNTIIKKKMHCVGDKKKLKKKCTVLVINSF